MVGCGKWIFLFTRQTPPCTFHTPDVDTSSPLHVSESHSWQHALVGNFSSDCVSALQWVIGHSPDHPIVAEILIQLPQPPKIGKVCCVLSGSWSLVDLSAVTRIVKPSVQEWQPSFIVVRKEEVKSTRFRLHHTRFARGYLLCESRHVSVETVVSNLLWHASWWTAHVMPKPAKCHLRGTLSDMLGDDLFSVSNILAFITTLRLSTSM